MSFFRSLIPRFLRKKKTLGIALGSGGAKGAVEIGALKRLLEEDIYPDELTGSSIGAIVATYLAADKFDLLLKRFRTFDNKAFIKLLDPSLRFKGLVKGEKMISLLRKDLGNLKFEDLKIKTKIIATDLHTGEPIVFDSGDVLLAIRASMSIPVFFTPVKYENYLLVDGGVASSLPLEFLDTDVKVGIDLTYVKVKRVKEDLLNISLKSLSIMEKINTDYKIKLFQNKEKDKKIFIISPEIDVLNALDFSKLKPLFRHGYLEMDKKIDEIKDALE